MFNSGSLNTASSFIFMGDCWYLQLTLKQCRWIKSATGKRKTKNPKHIFVHSRNLWHSVVQTAAPSRGPLGGSGSPPTLFSPSYRSPRPASWPWCRPPPGSSTEYNWRFQWKTWKTSKKGVRMSRNIHPVSEMERILMGESNLFFQGVFHLK